jgi:HSP20 family protein
LAAQRRHRRRLVAIGIVLIKNASGGSAMANLIKRDNAEVSRTKGREYRVDPFRVIDALLRWDPLRSDWNGFAPAGEFLPRFEVKETPNSYVINAELPGVKEEDVDVSLNGRQLTITVKREEERREDGEQYHAAERSYGTFARSFSLPDSVDAEGVRADLKSGVLTVQIPKRPEAQPKKIAIGRGGGENKAKA